MALAASPPPYPRFSRYEQMSETLDDEIQNIRDEINSLTERRKLLSATILNSTAVQSQLRGRAGNSTDLSISPDLQSRLNDASIHTESNIHRIALGVTAFPFTDPTPATSDDSLLDPHLLGIRFDITARDGKYKDPHYILCRRIRPDRRAFKVHKHTIPNLIPIKEYEARFLPGNEEGDELDGDESLEDSAIVGPTEKQNLHAFVSRIRQDLVSHSMRADAIESIAEQLGLRRIKTEDENAAAQSQPEANNLGILKFDATGPDALLIRIYWKDGRVGRIQLRDDGTIEKAAVFGESAEGKNVRLYGAERTLSGFGQDNSVLNIMDALKKLSKPE